VVGWVVVDPVWKLFDLFDDWRPMEATTLAAAAAYSTTSLLLAGVLCLLTLVTVRELDDLLDMGVVTFSETTDVSMNVLWFPSFFPFLPMLTNVVVFLYEIFGVTSSGSLSFGAWYTSSS